MVQCSGDAHKTRPMAYIYLATQLCRCEMPFYIDSLLHETQDESRRLLRLRNQTTKASATAFTCPTAHSTTIHYPKLKRLYRTPKLLKLSIGHLGRVWGCPAGFFSSRRPIRAGQSTLCCPCWACVDVKVGSCSRSSFSATRSRYRRRNTR